MKIYILVFVFFTTLEAFTQTSEDTLNKIHVNDSVLFSIPEYPISVIEMLPELKYTSQSGSLLSDNFFRPIYDTLPNCSDLIKKSGLFYFKQDTLPYCGACVVLHNRANHFVIAQYNGILFYSSMLHPPNESNWSNAYFITQAKDKIKILSSYKNGKRDGPREYYYTNGKLYKKENYSNGVIQSTQFVN